MEILNLASLFPFLEKRVSGCIYSSAEVEPSFSAEGDFNCVRYILESEISYLPSLRFCPGVDHRREPRGLCNYFYKVLYLFSQSLAPKKSEWVSITFLFAK